MSDPDDDEKVFAAIDGGLIPGGADLPTIIDRVDFSERIALSLDELDGALRRLTESGRIRERGPGRYVAARGPRRPRPYSGITEDEFDAAVRERNVQFAESAAQVSSSPLSRAMTALGERLFHWSRGRLGLDPGWIDHDALTVVYAAEAILAAVGATVADHDRGDGWVRLEVDGLGPEVDRSELAVEIERSIRRFGLPERRVTVRFPDGEEMQIC